MPTFSAKSLARLETCHPDLKRLFLEVIKTHDCTVLCGFRGKEEQEIAFKSGVSKAKWGQSKHNTMPSLAADVAPWPIDWFAEARWKEFAAHVHAVALSLGIKVRWGGDFKTLVDMPHWELTE